MSSVVFKGQSHFWSIIKDRVSRTAEKIFRRAVPKFSGKTNHGFQCISVNNAPFVSGIYYPFDSGQYYSFASGQVLPLCLRSTLLARLRSILRDMGFVVYYSHFLMPSV